LPETGSPNPMIIGHVSTLFGNPAVRLRGSVGLRRQVTLTLLLSESAAIIRISDYVCKEIKTNYSKMQSNSKHITRIPEILPPPGTDSEAAAYQDRTGGGPYRIRILLKATLPAAILTGPTTE